MVSDISKLTKESVIGNVKHKKQSDTMSDASHMTITVAVPAGKFTAKKVGQFSVPFRPYGVTCLPDDTIVVCKSRGGIVSVHQPSGRKLTNLQTSEGTRAVDVACTASSILVADPETNCVLEFLNNGSHIRSLPVNIQTGGRITALDNNYL